jgi:hypothetical protein
MLYTIAVILLVAWLLGFVGIYTVGFVHPCPIGGRDRTVPRRAGQRAARPGSDVNRDVDLVRSR